MVTKKVLSDRQVDRTVNMTVSDTMLDASSMALSSTISPTTTFLPSVLAVCVAHTSQRCTRCTDETANDYDTILYSHFLQLHADTVEEGALCSGPASAFSMWDA